MEGRFHLSHSKLKPPREKAGVMATWKEEESPVFLSLLFSVDSGHVLGMATGSSVLNTVKTKPGVYRRERGEKQRLVLLGRSLNGTLGFLGRCTRCETIAVLKVPQPKTHSATVLHLVHHMKS